MLRCIDILVQSIKTPLCPYSSHSRAYRINSFSLGENKRRTTSVELNPTTSNSPLGIINEGAMLPNDEIDDQSTTN